MAGGGEMFLLFSFFRSFFLRDTAGGLGVGVVGRGGGGGAEAGKVPVVGVR